MAKKWDVPIKSMSIGNTSKALGRAIIPGKLGRLDKVSPLVGAPFASLAHPLLKHYAGGVKVSYPGLTDRATILINPRTKLMNLMFPGIIKPSIL
jgi:hypothetical protein